MRERSRRLLAVLVVIFLAAPSWALAGAAQLRGRVVAADGVTPRSEVVVTLLDEGTRRTFASAPTDARGLFEIASAPPGTYTLLAETPAGAYLAGDAVRLRDGRNGPLSLALAADPAAGSGAAVGKGLAGWPKWIIVGGIVVGGLFVIDSLTKDEESASAF